jgi:DNA-binding transcriptional LysR family regulator
MSLKQLRYVITLYEELHFRRAAQLLNVSQATLTQQIRTLEYRIGVSLFERTSRKVAPTQAGRLFVEEARHVLAAADRAVRSVQSRVDVRPKLRLAVDHFGMMGRVPALLSAFGAENPAVEITLLERISTGRQCEMVLSGDIDAGFGNTLDLPCEISARPLDRWRLGVLMALDHPLSEFKEVEPHHLTEQNFVELTDDWFATAMAPLLPRVRMPPTPSHRFPDTPSIMAVVATGRALALWPMLSAPPEPDRLVLRAISGSAAFFMSGILWSADRPNPSVNRLLALNDSLGRKAVTIGADW